LLHITLAKGGGTKTTTISGVVAENREKKKENHDRDTCSGMQGIKGQERRTLPKKGQRNGGEKCKRENQSSKGGNIPRGIVKWPCRPQHSVFKKSRGGKGMGSVENERGKEEEISGTADATSTMEKNIDLT